MKNKYLKKIVKITPRYLKQLIKFFLFPSYYSRIFLNDMQALTGKISYATKIIFVAGYPKSGTTWMENFISNIPGYNPRAIYGDSELIRHHNLPTDSFSKIPKYGYSAIKSHIFPSPENIDVLVKSGISKILVMYRDPRDIVVSNYYHTLKENHWEVTDDFYADYNRMKKEDAISHSIEIVLSDYTSWVRGWINISDLNSGINCMYVKYEDFRDDPKETLKKVLIFFNIDILESEFNSIFLKSQKSSKWINSFLPGMKSTKRNGSKGEWKSEFNPKHKRIFKKLASDILIELDYEKDINW